MGVREAINENPKMVAGIGVVVLLLVVGYLFILNRASGGSSDAGPAVDRAFFSTDDGKTWFADSSENLAPFTHDGKEAVRANVFKCTDGKPFVAFLQRYTPEGKKRFQSATSGKRPEIPFGSAMLADTEVKRPNDTAWVNEGDPKAAAITTPKCPDGSIPHPVLP